MARRARFSAVIVLAVCAAVGTTSPSAAQSLSPAEAKQLAVEAYIYGYPLITMEMTRRVLTNVAQAEGTRAPMGHLIRLREYPTAAFRDVTAPNADTLYTTAFIDVGSEPYVLSIPDAHDRYYLFPMLDAWTEVFQAPGKRTTGTGPQKYAITGPNWTGSLPEGVEQYKSPTSLVWILGRIYCTGMPEDYAAVHRMQDEVSLVPLSAYGKSYSPPEGKVDPSIDMKTPVRDQVNALSTEAYFSLLAELLKDNPPSAADAPMVAKLKKLGIVPGEPVDLAKLGDAAVAALQDVPKLGFGEIMGHFKEAGKDLNGWTFTTQAGVYGVDYLQRAFVTAIGLGANRPEDAVYPTSETGADGQPYLGTNKYVMHFAKGQFPPVNGFWSLTMYNEQMFFVDNPLNRYTLSARDKFTTNADGSVDLYLQHENPGGDKEANWLPAPAGRFIPMLRLYWPKEPAPSALSILNGTWTPPAIRKAD
ncbi:MAG TPA: DUF1254 domain-containing protein [Lacipirellulaceae bacterium]|nr:DUF1254 domain-containing protein [Lacipirellulaceae bacterium]